MKLGLSTFCLILFSFNSLSQVQTDILEESSFSIGKTFKVQSGILKEKRVINIYLPNSYNEDSLQKYPVIYLLDGSRDEDFIHISGLVQFASFSWINMIPESIVVGISNIDRHRDFTYPSSNQRDLKELPTSGESKKFMSFIKNELIPLIQHRFRTSTQKTLIGQSLGGLFATEVLFNDPELFNNYIIVSPSLWWDNESLLKEKLPKNMSSANIFIAVGKEGDNMERIARELYEKIKTEKGSDMNLHFNFLKNKKHGDVLHQAVYNAFDALFSDPDKKLGNER